jgi:phosphonoacetaldehyde hydrolase
MEHKVGAVIFDWAGTVVDHGCWAPVTVFMDVFHQQGVEVSLELVRSRMGMAKREHIRSILFEPEISALWEAKQGAAPTEGDVDALYEHFLRDLPEGIAAHSDLIQGVPEVVEYLRAEGIRLGSTTGYPAEVMEGLIARARERGFAPEAILTASDVPEGRPAPWMIFRLAEQFRIYPLSRIVKIDDTVAGIEAGRNAGCWTVGVSASGNILGLSERSLRDLSAEKRASLLEKAEATLRAAGAHFVIPSVATLPAVIDEINERLARGERP